MIVSENVRDGEANTPKENPDWEWLTITLVMLGKFSVSASNVIMPVFTAELFPTVIRNLGVGSSNVPAGIALMIIPSLWNLVSKLSHLYDNVYTRYFNTTFFYKTIGGNELSFANDDTGYYGSRWRIFCIIATRNCESRIGRDTQRY